ncbi:RNA ligase [Providencia rustigianii]
MMNMQSRKYGRTYHYPFSPGTTSDDRINSDWWAHIQNIEQLVHTEKLDGENNCLSRYGVFARSHGAPTQSAWTQQIRQRWQLIKDDLGILNCSVKMYMPFIRLNINISKITFMCLR